MPKPDAKPQRQPARRPKRLRPRRPWWWRGLAGLQSMLTGGLASLIVLALTFWILPQVSSDGALPLIRLVVIFAVIGLLMRWVLTGVAMLIGSVGVLIGGMVSQF